MRQLSRMLGELFRAPKVRQPDYQRKARAECKRLIAEHGIEVERLRGGGLNVWPPKGLAVDPFEGDHYCADWNEALPLVREYAKT